MSRTSLVTTDNVPPLQAADVPTLPFPQHLDRPLSLYVHVPFCQKRCIYCDFATFTGQEHQMPAYVAALEQEIERRCDGLRRPPAQTIFFGGGTPSLLPPPLLGRILAALRRHFEIDPRAEITMEANPGTVDAAHLKEVRALGINRLSFGVQSLNDRKLRVLGRIHSADDALEALALARRGGFDNLSADLIYALPGQTMADWRATLSRMLQQNLPHLSLYALTPEEGTPLWRALERGELRLPVGDRAAEMYEWARDELAAHGYKHYEISNWARPGWKSRHNMAYWVQTPYLGFGVSAHGYFEGERRGNVRGLAAYLNRIAQGKDAAASRETIDQARARSDAMIFGLRMIDGVDRARYRAQFAADPLDLWPAEIARLCEQGLLQVTPQAIALTRAAHLLGNYVWEHFL
jgi:oxygen-independent coproporphyrinogen-3 oxidase